MRTVPGLFGVSNTEGVRLRRAATLAVANTTNVDIAWDTEDEDGAGWWSTGATLTCPRQGWYVVTVGASPASGTTWQIRMVAGGVQAVNQPQGAASGLGLEMSVTMVRSFAVGDTLVATVRHSTGSSVNLTSAYLNLVRVA